MVCISTSGVLLLLATLFILYFGLKIDSRLSHCQVVVVEMQFKLGGKLVGKRTRDQALLYCQST